MAGPVIVSEETLRNLLEAHASMAAWYYRLSEALRAAGARVEPPSDAERAAFLAQAAAHFPEIARVAHAVTVPRPYIPPPAVQAPERVAENEGGASGPAVAADAATAGADSHGADADADADTDAIAPPPRVDPTKVRYE
ncbi:MAG: hypothetical protein HY744_03525 [Deltaproteobacteria bacterium]|nr:hypothetical protein [Deltaproteobacteria bacterium]